MLNPLPFRFRKQRTKQSKRIAISINIMAPWRDFNGKEVKRLPSSRCCQCQIREFSRNYYFDIDVVKLVTTTMLCVFGVCEIKVWKFINIPQHFHHLCCCALFHCGFCCCLWKIFLQENHSALLMRELKEHNERVNGGMITRNMQVHFSNNTWLRFSKALHRLFSLRLLCSYKFARFFSLFSLFSPLES
jgi:hypothetical protein